MRLAAFISCMPELALAVGEGVVGPFLLHVLRDFNLNGRHSAFCGCEISQGW